MKVDKVVMYFRISKKENEEVKEDKKIVKLNESLKKINKNSQFILGTYLKGSKF